MAGHVARFGTTGGDEVGSSRGAPGMLRVEFHRDGDGIVGHLLVREDDMLSGGDGHFIGILRRDSDDI